jgi:hypothetical protein
VAKVEQVAARGRVYAHKKDDLQSHDDNEHEFGDLERSAERNAARFYFVPHHIGRHAYFGHRRCMIVPKLDQLFFQRLHRCDEFGMMLARIGLNVVDMAADHRLSASGLNPCSLQQFAQALQFFHVCGHRRKISALDWQMTLPIAVERRPVDRSAKQTRAFILVLLKGRIKMRGGRPPV